MASLKRWTAFVVAVLRMLMTLKFVRHRSSCSLSSAKTEVGQRCCTRARQCFAKSRKRRACTRYCTPPGSQRNPCATEISSLRDRATRNGARKLVKIIRAAEFATVQYKIKYPPVPTRSSKKRGGRKEASAKDTRRSSKSSSDETGRRPVTATARRA